MTCWFFDTFFFFLKEIERLSRSCFNFGLSVFIYVYLYLFMHILIYFDIFWCILMYFGLHWSYCCWVLYIVVYVFRFVDVCLHIGSFQNINWSKLGYLLLLLFLCFEFGIFVTLIYVVCLGSFKYLRLRCSTCIFDLLWESCFMMLYHVLSCYIML